MKRVVRREVLILDRLQLAQGAQLFRSEGNTVPLRRGDAASFTFTSTSTSTSTSPPMLVDRVDRVVVVAAARAGGGDLLDATLQQARDFLEALAAEGLCHGGLRRRGLAPLVVVVVVVTIDLQVHEPAPAAHCPFASPFRFHPPTPRLEWSPVESSGASEPHVARHHD